MHCHHVESELLLRKRRLLPGPLVELRSEWKATTNQQLWWTGTVLRKILNFPLGLNLDYYRSRDDFCSARVVTMRLNISTEQSINHSFLL
jgi:hypothetical protein